MSAVQHVVRFLVKMVEHVLDLTLAHVELDTLDDFAKLVSDL